MDMIGNFVEEQNYESNSEREERLALLAKDVINLLAEHNLTVCEAEDVLSKVRRGICDTTKVQALDWEAK